MRALLAKGAEAGAVTTTGAVPLHFAAASGNVDAITALLDAGADPNAREPQWGQTPLMFAAAAGRTEAVSALVAGGADLAAAAKVVDISARNARTPPRAAPATRASPRSRSSGPPNAPPPAAPIAGAAPRGPRAAPTTTPATSPSRSATPNWSARTGGLTALLLASRDGHADDGVRADRRRRQHQPGEHRRITPARC